MDENSLFEKLISNQYTLEDKKNSTLEFVLDNHRTLAKKSFWMYKKLKSLGSNLEDTSNFESKYLQSWIVYYLSASLLTTNNKQLGISNNEPTLYITYHFPEYPLLGEFVNKYDILTMVASDSLWLSNFIKDEANLYNFRSPKLSSKLVRAFKERKSILAMFDYCYETSRSITSNFLGIEVKTPYAILILAKRHNYKVKFIYDNNGFYIKECPEDNYLALTQTINNLITERIYKNPAQWLLWPSLDTRWTFNDEKIYNTSL